MMSLHSPLPVLATVLLSFLAAGCSPSLAESNDANLLLVTIDSVRADRIGAYGYQEARTPVIDSLAERGVLFEEAYAPAPLTLPVHATLLTGLLPPEHGARVNGMHRLAADVPTLGARLQGKGYRTGAFVAAFVLDQRFGLGEGFDVYDDDLRQAYAQETPETLSRYRPGEQVVDSALDWLEQGTTDQPFFAWVHLYDAHFPWHPHDEETGSYDGEVAYVDQQVGRLVDYLQTKRLEGDTYLVVLADHGEGLGDHHEIEHGYLLNEEVLRVPWVMTGPGIRAGHRVPELVGLEDFHPTALELLGVVEPDRARSLVPALRAEALPERARYAETDLPWTAYRWGPQRSLTTADWKYIRSPQPELYDRRTDRGELCNLASTRREVLAELEARLQRLESGLDFRETAAAQVGAEELAQLSALGYAAGSEGEVPDLAGLADMKQRLAVKDLVTDLRRGIASNTLAPSERLAMARQLVEVSPETPSFHVELGQAYTALGEWQRALPPLEKAVELAPIDPQAHYALGDALQQCGEIASAREHLELVLRMDPSMAEARVGMGNVLRSEGRPDLAAGEYAEALRLKPAYAEANYNLAQTFFDRGMPERGLDKLRLALAQKPGWGLAHRGLANVLLGLGRPEEAVEHFAAALASYPADANLHNDLGVAHLRLGHHEEAHAAYVRALECDPQFYRPYVNLGNLAFDFGRDELAHERYEAAVQLAPGLAEPYALLARFLATTPAEDLRNGPRAVSLAERAFQLAAGRSPQLLDTLAAAYAAAGRFEDALAAATDAENQARRLGDEELARAIGGRAALYATEQPYRVQRSTPAPTEATTSPTAER